MSVVPSFVRFFSFDKYNIYYLYVAYDHANKCSEVTTNDTNSINYYFCLANFSTFFLFLFDKWPIFASEKWATEASEPRLTCFCLYYYTHLHVPGTHPMRLWFEMWKYGVCQPSCVCVWSRNGNSIRATQNRWYFIHSIVEYLFVNSLTVQWSRHMLDAFDHTLFDNRSALFSLYLLA